MVQFEDRIKSGTRVWFWFIDGAGALGSSKVEAGVRLRVQLIIYLAFNIMFCIFVFV